MGLVFVPRAIAHEEVAFRTAATWAEFRKVAPDLHRRAVEFLRRDALFDGVVTDGPQDEEPFDPSFVFENELNHSIYRWMFDNIPAEVGKEFGRYEASIMTGETLCLDGEHEAEIVAALRARGFAVEKDQALIDALLE